jgi:hypothetical protein
MQMTFWTILSKVRWGGVLVCFSALMHLLGSEPGEDIEELLEPQEMTRFERSNYSVQQLVENIGFFEILASMSIPYPLGLTWFGFIPFLTFRRFS